MDDISAKLPRSELRIYRGEDGKSLSESAIWKFWIADSDDESYESTCSTPDEGPATCKNLLQVRTGLMLDLHGVQSSIINLKSEMIPC
jgi:hypothetical protein